MHSPPVRARDPRARRLLRLFDGLDGEAQRTLLRFAEFLAQEKDAGRETAVGDRRPPQPRSIPRPKDESVVKAIRRLADTYFMLDKDALLNETSTLMAQHVMQGRSAAEVIDDLERLFREEYERLVGNAK